MPDFDEKELNNLKQQLIKNRRGYLVIKRIIDIIGASIGLLFCILVMLIIMLLIKIEDPNGPVIFTQVRCG